MRTSLVEDALKAAAATRGTLTAALFHSDHGSVYTSKDYARLCSDLGVTQSMGAVGTSADSSLAESFNATLKREDPQGLNSWRDEITCRRDVFRWLTRYNTRRRLLVSLPVPSRLRDRLRRYAPRQPRAHTPCPRAGGKALPRRHCECQFRPSTVGAVASVACSSPNYWLITFLVGIVAGGTPVRAYGGRFGFAVRNRSATSTLRPVACCWRRGLDRRELQPRARALPRCAAQRLVVRRRGGDGRSCLGRASRRTPTRSAVIQGEDLRSAPFEPQGGASLLIDRQPASIDVPL